MSPFRRMSFNDRHALILRLAKEVSFNARELSKRLDTSTRQLQRIFQEDYQCSPQAWLNELRIQQAYEMLQKSDQIKEVAYSLGYKHTSHFSREFKRVHGCQPSALHSRDYDFRLRDACHEIIEDFVCAIAQPTTSEKVLQKPTAKTKQVLISNESRVSKIIQPHTRRLNDYRIDYATNDNEVINKSRELQFDLIIFSKSLDKHSIFSTNRQSQCEVPTHEIKLDDED